MSPRYLKKLAQTRVGVVEKNRDRVGFTVVFYKFAWTLDSLGEL